MAVKTLQSAAVSASDFFKSYELAHTYVIRELTLINMRLTWVLTINGFLLSIYALTLPKIIDSQGDKIQNTTTPIVRAAKTAHQISPDMALLVITAFIGLSVSSFGYLSIAAACKAMRSVSDIYGKNFFSDELGPSSEGEEYPTYYMRHGYRLPSLLGGGEKGNNRVGNRASMGIPLLLCLVWILGLLALIRVLLLP